ncbi:helix-turn-helix domain-containing protein [Thermopolyspora sp. NPDC052614]|uniref:TetR/AcrR family transcriptional regulator n=1 Tax=Thermopolyspora sp. NPDC052614 TaxID=3155682 RepID=UPI0034146F4C
MTDRLPHMLRADARDNRERILGAARELFAAEGLDVPTRTIARHAGVSPATLYRHFPTKRTLVTEAFAEEMRACQASLDENCADPDPWRGFRRLIERVCEMQARNQGFTDAFLAQGPVTADLAAAREHAFKSLAELTRRAKAAGQLRQEFTLTDLILMLQAHSGLPSASTPARLTASRRYATLMIQAFQAPEPAGGVRHSVGVRPVMLASSTDSVGDYLA